MATFSEFYVTQHANANYQNGGSGTGAPTSTCSATLSGASNPYTLTRATGSFLSDGVAVGEFGTWDCDNATLANRQSFYVSARDATTLTVWFGATPTAGTKNLRVGGAWALPSQAANALQQWGSTKWAAASIANPPRINVKYEGGTAYTEDNNIATAGGNYTANIPLFISGYITSPGDIDWTTATALPTVDLLARIVSIGTYYTYVYNLAFTSTSTGNVLTLAAAYNALYNVTMTNTGSTNSLVYLTSNYCHIARVKAVRNTAGAGNCFYLAGNGGSAYACIAVGPGQASTNGLGFKVTAVGGHLLNCVAYNCGNGLSLETYRIAAMNCSLYNNYNGISIPNGDRTPTLLIVNNKIGYNSNYGITSAASGPWYGTGIGYNEYVSNSVGNVDTNTITTVYETGNQLTSSMFVDYTTNDYTPSTTSLGNSTAFPTVMNDGRRSYRDMGASGLITPTLPAATAVTEGTTYGYSGATVGTYHVTTAAETKYGTTFGASQTLTGTLRSTDPGEANVIKDVTYIIESVNKTGTYTYQPSVPDLDDYAGIEAALRTTILNTTAITDVISTRMFAVVKPVKETYPCIVYVRTNTDREYTVKGNAGIAYATVQIVCMATTYITVVGLAALVRNCLLSVSGTWGSHVVDGLLLENEQDDFVTESVDGKSGVYHRILTYRIAYEEEAGNIT